jgi:hypothetical protein
MFAARFFAPRYFAPRYFDKVGATGAASADAFHLIPERIGLRALSGVW